ncbi:MAG TPA: hypothetical protein VEA60_10675 [Allosphingosinicella sp.]|nr:hypothetical protein [Allosphingosinicella sp.]
MRHFNVVAAVAAAMLMSGLAGAKDKPEAVKEKKICRDDMASNSRIAVRRICRTKAEWAELEGESQRSAGRAVEASNRRN